MIKSKVLFVFSVLLFSDFIYAMDENQNNPVTKYEVWKLVDLEKDRSRIKIGDKCKCLKVILLSQPKTEYLTEDRSKSFMTFDFWYPHQIKNGQLKFADAKTWIFKVEDIYFLNNTDFFYIKSVNEKSGIEVLLKVKIPRASGALIDEKSLSFFSKSEAEAKEEHSDSSEVIDYFSKEVFKKSCNFPEERSYSGLEELTKKYSISRYVTGGFLAAISLFIVLYKMGYVPENMQSWFATKYSVIFITVFHVVGTISCQFLFKLVVSEICV